jgi:ubiquinone biosynthesis protein
MEMILTLATNHKMLLPPDFMLISRALFQFDGFCRDLDPDYELVAVLEPVVAEFLWKNLTSAKKQKEVVEDTVGELMKFFRTFPHTLNQVVRRVERNELRTTIDVAGLEGLKSAQGRSALKLSFTGIMAALIIGLGIVYTGPDPQVRASQFLFSAGVIVVIWTLILVLWSETMKGHRE